MPAWGESLQLPTFPSRVRRSSVSSTASSRSGSVPISSPPTSTRSSNGNGTRSKLYSLQDLLSPSISSAHLRRTSTPRRLSGSYSSMELLAEKEQAPPKKGVRFDCEDCRAPAPRTMFVALQWVAEGMPT
eukprot:TRINITY_DN53438_c0_g1_i2.p1 TRINITY_DN53438_c0_g1~~TRINITY_DN53438_c0_g1_i2.p1  ORF type:complete len:130 (+),score=16.31 TRINITY_DN53438_c0_g1_i2:78-467(+)